MPTMRNSVSRLPRERIRDITRERLVLENTSAIQDLMPGKRQFELEALEAHGRFAGNFAAGSFR